MVTQNVVESNDEITVELLHRLLVQLSSASLPPTGYEGQAHITLAPGDIHYRSGGGWARIQWGENSLQDGAVTEGKLHQGVIEKLQSNEEVKVLVGEMVSGNTERLIAVTFQAADSTLDFDLDARVQPFRFGTAEALPADLQVGETYVQYRLL